MAFNFPPKLMQAPAAAHYLGMSCTKLRQLNIPQKSDGGNTWYHRADLDAYADSLPYKGTSVGEAECDQVFGTVQ